MKRKLIGLNTYIYSFPTRAQMLAWRERNEGRAAITEIFVNNGWALEVRFLRTVLA